MGGGHHVEIPKVPDPSIYKVEDHKVLLKLQKRLAEKGLKDPWIRNHVWRCYETKELFSRWVFTKFFLHGCKYWIPLLGITIAVENFLGIDYSGHNHGHEHNNHRS